MEESNSSDASSPADDLSSEDVIVMPTRRGSLPIPIPQTPGSRSPASKRQRHGPEHQPSTPPALARLNEQREQEKESIKHYKRILARHVGLVRDNKHLNEFVEEDSARRGDPDAVCQAQVNSPLSMVYLDEGLVDVVAALRVLARESWERRAHLLDELGGVAGTEKEKAVFFLAQLKAACRENYELAKAVLEKAPDVDVGSDDHKIDEGGAGDWGGRARADSALNPGDGKAGKSEVRGRRKTMDEDEARRAQEVVYEVHGRKRTVEKGIGRRRTVDEGQGRRRTLGEGSGKGNEMDHEFSRGKQKPEKEDFGDGSEDSDASRPWYATSSGSEKALPNARELFQQILC